jgi:hypothetical protein
VKALQLQALTRERGCLDDTRISGRNHRARTLPEGGAGASKENRRWVLAAKAAASASYIPSHVQHCSNNPDRVGRWTLAFWPKVAPVNQTRVAYTCDSYRCPSPECQRKAAHTDFARIAQAVSSVGENPEAWCLLVLTIDQLETLNRRKAGNGWRDEQEAFKCLSRMTRIFLKRLRRWHVREGWEDFANRWIATVEVQRNGWPHINLMMHSPGLAKWLDAQPKTEAMHKGRRVTKSPLSGELKEHAIACDWGAVGDASRARNRDALMGYIVKLAGSFDRTVGEIAKLTQAPTNARMKLRRIRAGVGFLPPREKNPEWTGIMLKREAKFGGAPTVKPLMEPDQVRCPKEEQENYLLGAREAIKAEQAQSDAEWAGAHEVKHTGAKERDERRFNELSRALFGAVGPHELRAKMPPLGEARRYRHERQTLPGMREGGPLPRLPARSDHSSLPSEHREDRKGATPGPFIVLNGQTVSRETLERPGHEKDTT